MDATAVKNIECDDEEARKLVAMILDKCLKEQRENNGPRIEEECRGIEETASLQNWKLLLCLMSMKKQSIKLVKDKRQRLNMVMFEQNVEKEQVEAS